MSNERELTIEELDAVSGGTSDLGKYITKAVDDALSSPSGPPEVWVGCAWVPQWW
jgi:bacteriocin-like protein